MLCGNCGKKVPDDAVFCSYCGAAIHPKKASAEKAESTGGEKPNLPKKEKAQKPSFADNDRIGNTFQFDKKSGTKLSYVKNSNFRAPTPSKDITTNLGPLKKKNQINESKPVLIVVSLFAVFLLIISIIWTVQRKPSSGSKTTAGTETAINAVEPVTESSSDYTFQSSPAGEVIETTTQRANSGSFTTRPNNHITYYTFPNSTVTTSTTIPASTTTTETTGWWNMTTTSTQTTNKY